MTDKIIINGIDVSECKYWNKHAVIQNVCGLTGEQCIDIQCPEMLNQTLEQLKRLQEENNILRQTIKNKNFVAIVEENEELKNKKDEYYLRALDYEAKISYLIQALEETRNIVEKLITETSEYNSCYYKDECGDNCTPKKQSKVEYCCYENVDKILTIVNEVLNERG